MRILCGVTDSIDTIVTNAHKAIPSICFPLHRLPSDIKNCKSGQLKSSQFPSHGLRETTPAHSGSSYCLDLSASLSQYFSFLLYRSPPISSRYSSSTFSLEARSESSFLYSKGILPQCLSDPLPFPYSDLHCHWFLLCTPLQFLTTHSVKAIHISF
jgi:hypothetical protein